MLKACRAVRIAMRRLFTSGLFVCIPAVSLAYGAELVTLRSGFTLTCSSREAISASMVRLYLPGGTSPAANYIDVPVDSLASIDIAPDTLTQNPVSAPVAVPPDSLAGLLRRAGAAHNMNVALLASVVRAESAGNPRAVSRAGARGLMQLMPSTARELGVSDSFQQDQNVNGGSAYLDRLLTRYHEDIALALAAYNAGPGAVDRYRGIPPFRETRLYIARVLSEFNRRIRQDAFAVEPVSAAKPTSAVGIGSSR